MANIRDKAGYDITERVSIRDKTVYDIAEMVSIRDKAGYDNTKWPTFAKNWVRYYGNAQHSRQNWLQ
jgi:hypothetical protein